MAILDPNILVKLVQTGALGAAIACMLTSFWLLWTINKQPHTPSALPILKEKNRAACFFMAFSALCLLFAFLTTIFSPKPDSEVEYRLRWNPDYPPRFVSDALVPKAFVDIDGKRSYLARAQRISCPKSCDIFVDYQAVLENSQYWTRTDAKQITGDPSFLGQGGGGEER